MTSRPKLPIRQLFLGYKDLWKTIADLQQGLRGWGQHVANGFFNKDSWILELLTKCVWNRACHLKPIFLGMEVVIVLMFETTGGLV